MTCGRVNLSSALWVTGLTETTLGDLWRNCFMAYITFLFQHDSRAILAQSNSGLLHQEVSEVTQTPAQGADFRRGPQWSQRNRHKPKTHTDGDVKASTWLECEHIEALWPLYVRFSFASTTALILCDRILIHAVEKVPNVPKCISFTYAISIVQYNSDPSRLQPYVPVHTGGFLLCSLVCVFLGHE